MDAFVPQFSSLTIEQITEAFAREVVSHAKVNITAVIRENLPMWETKLFPVISRYEISRYEVVADILVSAGCRSAFTTDAEKTAFIKTVGNAVRAIKQSNGELTAKQKREVARSIISADKMRPGVRLTEQSNSHPPSVMQGQNSKEGVAPSHPVAHVPVAITKPQVVAKAVQVADTKQYNLDEFPFLEHDERVNKDVLAGYSGKGIEWNAQDDELLAVFSQISQSKFTPLEKLNNIFSSVEEIKKGCYAKFKQKCKLCGIDLKEHGFKM